MCAITTEIRTHDWNEGKKKLQHTPMENRMPIEQYTEIEWSTPKSWEIGVQLNERMLLAGSAVTAYH